MKFGIVIFPGSNCDQDMLYALETIMEQKVVLLWHKNTDLQDCDFIILPGGFSYGDYLRSGAIARFSPIMEKVVEFSMKGGYVMGICNGFQILCETGLLPGALLHNKNQKFMCKNVYTKVENKDTLLTSSVPANKALKIPLAHAEGLYYADTNLLNQLNAKGQILFRYCDENANITEDANPNGSLENIAGICNAAKNVFGMMPHPERAVDKTLGNTDGRVIFESILDLVNS